MKTTLELIELMRRAKAGDKTAFEAVYASCYRPVFHYLLRRIRNSKDAEDLAQQVFLRLYTSATTFADQTISPLAYLFTAARNTLLTFVGRENRFQYQELEGADEIVEPGDIEHHVEQIDLVKRAMAILPDEQRQVIDYKFTLGLTTQEIAMRLGKTEAAIRQMQCRALRRMRNFLGEKH